jgi:CRISPR-associated protein Cas1
VQLVINTFGACLRKQGEQFVVIAGDKKLAISAHKVQSILITTSVQLTTDAIELALAHNTDLVVLDRHGEPLGRFWQSRMGSTATIRRRQLEAAAGPEGLALALSWVEAKLRHQVEFLEELQQRRPGGEGVFEGPLGTIRANLARLSELVGTLEEQRGTVMGLEGSAGRAYFGCLGQLVPETFRFTRRSRQPAEDGFNAMLNYGYGVLYSLVEKACVCAGLDVHLGFLHTDNYAKPSLVFDLIEPFRIVAERATLLLFTGRGVRYPVQGHPGRCRNIKQRDVIQHEAHALANMLLGKRDLPRIVETRKIWEEGASVEVDEDGPEVAEEAVTLPEAKEEPC